MDELVTVSRRYGGDANYVVAGGGNTSWKSAGNLYIKASGAALESIDTAGFVRMDRGRLAAIWSTVYPVDQDQRETAVLADMMAARCPGEEAKRPSVETLLHDLLPPAFVVHTHPALVNGITCSREGVSAARRLFGAECLWIPSTNPGYILASIVKTALAEHVAHTGHQPELILLQNHGIFVAADTVAGLDAIYQRVMATIAARITRTDDAHDLPAPEAAARSGAALAVVDQLAGLVAGQAAGQATTPASGQAAGQAATPATGRAAGQAATPATGRAAGQAATPATGQAAGQAATQATTKPAAVHFVVNKEIARLTASREAFAAVAAPFSPDHIVYAGSDFLFADAAGPVLEQAYADYFVSHGRTPKLAAIRGLGVFGIGAGGNARAAHLAVALFMDAASIAAYAEAFGGPRPMSREQIDFINNWEVERYRSKVSAGS
jgi:rhamnose utilization protein RhaD (predicted bifunctional aldolase and dehydrogenase)